MPYTLLPLTLSLTLSLTPTPTQISSSFVITDEAGEVVGVIAADCIGADGCSVSKTPAVREMLDRLFQDDAESDGPRGGA